MAKQKQPQETAAVPTLREAPAPAKEAKPLQTNTLPVEWWVGIRVAGPAKYDVMACGVDGIETTLESGVDIASARATIHRHSRNRLFHPAG